jgi:hypothetical protein
MGSKIRPHPPLAFTIFFVLSVGLTCDGAMLYALWQWQNNLIDNGQLIAGSMLFGATGIGSTIWGLLLVWKRVQWVRIVKELKTNGAIAQGTVTKIDRDKRYSSGKNLTDYPWFIVVEWKDPSGSKHISESELLHFDASTIVKNGDSIDVRYYVRNPHLSWVDVSALQQ